MGYLYVPIEAYTKNMSGSRGNSPPHKHVKLKPTYQVVNIVTKAKLDIELDLYGLARMSHNIDYEPEQFPGAILKVKDPKASILLFKNGNMVCAGARKVSDVKKAIDKAVDLVNAYVSSKSR
jgi:transcription initiation factor TFIID TATA-box-binding protein